MTHAPDGPQTPDGTGTPAGLDAWAQRLREALELDVPSTAAGEQVELDIGAVLDLARDAAHGVARPAAPLTLYLLGIAVGRAGDDPDAQTRAWNTTIALLQNP